ncbi:CoA-transferase [Pseudorhodobacter turbinis]|nr:CoA-transferase [Pseudorhodobacter turbinis]
MLRRALDEGKRKVRLSILGSVEHNFFTNGSTELFDSAGQGRLDAFFLGGGQIDKHANINLVGVGEYPQSTVRWPGSFGSAYLYFTVPRVILFREEHTPRVFVDEVDFISAPGISPPEVYRPGGPVALLTSKAMFSFDKAKPGFKLESIHPGQDLRDLIAATGFDFDHQDQPSVTPAPDTATLALLRGRVMDELKETYPAFAESWQSDLADQY